MLQMHRAAFSTAHLSHLDQKLLENARRAIPDLQLQASWGNMEKETLKKYLLIYGYGRWIKIRNFSAG